MLNFAGFAGLENTMIGAGTGILVVLVLMGAISVAASVGGTKWRLIGLAVNAGIIALTVAYFGAVENIGLWLAVQSGVYAGAQGAVQNVAGNLTGMVTGTLNSLVNSVLSAFGI